MKAGILTIVGAGLIGASLGLAARRRGVARTVRGLGRSQASLDLARPVAALDRTVSFWYALGARTRIMSPEEHDRGLAITSHLPHLLASALAGILPAELVDLCAGGFRDTTRIAAGDPSLWTAIFAHNQTA